MPDVSAFEFGLDKLAITWCSATVRPIQEGAERKLTGMSSIVRATPAVVDSVVR